MEKLTLTRRNHIAWITINRPEIRNAIDFDVMNQLREYLREIKENDDDKILVITGAGNRAFCSGGDLSAFEKLETSEQAYNMLHKMGSVLHELCLFKKPTVALLNGTAVGGGCEIATACDIRLASEKAKLGFIQGTLGITTGWGGATMLYERLETAHAMQLLMTSRLITASEAKKIGFVQEIFQDQLLQEQAEYFLEPFVKQHVNVLKAYKEVFIEKMIEAKLQERMLNEITRCSKLWGSDAHKEAVHHFLSKKK